MLKEFVETIARQAVMASAPKTTKYDPTDFLLIRKPDGTAEKSIGMPPWRNHKARDLETLVSFAESAKNSAIWYSRSEVVCLLDDADRRDRVSVSMILSPQIRALQSMQDSKSLYTQKELLFTLRTNFTQSALPKFPNLIDLLRVVKFQTAQQAEANLQRGKSSVGKAMQSEASFVEEVPEQIQLSVPVFENSFGRKEQELICALEVHEDIQKFQLFPLPGEVEKAFYSAEAEISKLLRDLIGEGKTKVYYGQP